MLFLKTHVTLLIGCLIFCLNGCSRTDILLEQTNSPASIPDNNLKFSTYVSESRENIKAILDHLRPDSEHRSYLGGYNNQDAANMRGPFQIPEESSVRCTEKLKGGSKGFLLIHGLTDSPYLMRSLSDSLISEYPCALIRAILLPGHGTVAGDSLNMKYQDWMSITEYGIKSFQKDEKITDLYLVGFSTGTALAIKYMKNNTIKDKTLRKDKIKGLVLISTAVKAKTNFSWLAPVIKWMKPWGGTYSEKDAARYESFSMNAGAQFHKLTKGMVNPSYALDIPVLMAVSADDDTIDAMAAREYFCYSSHVKRRALLWYQSINPKINSSINSKDTPELMCGNIVEIALNTIKPDYRTKNLAHTALSMNPNDPHYGLNGKYRNCKSYDKNSTADDFDQCQKGTCKTVFGENNIKKLKDKLGFDYWRRGTFNPDYVNLEKNILCFTKDDCAIDNIINLRK